MQNFKTFILTLLVMVVSMPALLSQSYSYVFSPTIGQYTECGSGTYTDSRFNYSSCYNASGSLSWTQGHVKASVWDFDQDSGELIIRVKKCSGYFSNGNTLKVFVRESYVGDVAGCRGVQAVLG